MNNSLMKRVTRSPLLNSQALTIMRSVGEEVDGRWVEGTPIILNIRGVASPSTQKELRQLPEGDRVTGSITFTTVDELFISHGGETPGTSDIIIWKGNKYRLLSVFQWGDYGFYTSIAIRMRGD